MANVPITLTAADYARLMPLAAGDVTADGIDLRLMLGSQGSWPKRAEMLARALNDPAVDGGEGSVAGHWRRIDQGDRSHVALPVFVLRNFTGRDLYVLKGGPVKEPKDLIGRRLGMYNWVASGSVWYRHFLTYLGVPLEKIEWWIGDIDSPHASTHKVTLPKGVNPVAPGRFLSEMLLKGEVDAIYSPPRPKLYHPEDGPIVRLLADPRGVERAYFQKTGVYPQQHLIIVRRAVWEKNPWILKALTDAFLRGNEHYLAAQRGFPYALPWFELELEETRRVMGEDFQPDGFDRNRRALKAFAKQAYQAGVTSRLVSVEECFVEFLESQG
jgi:4,5-dihydroxyphthalate decarboxylase